jgi:glycosyltransferase involved in cell wall biosynthesis
VIVGDVPRPDRPVAGGPANATERLVRGLAAAGMRVTVVAPATLDEPPRSIEMHGAEVLVVPHAQRLMLPRRLGPWRSVAIPIVNRLEADIVHGQGVVEGGVIAAGASPAMARVVTARGNLRRDTLAQRPGLGGRARAGILDRLAASVIGSVDVTVDVHPDWRVNLPRQPGRLVHIDNIVDGAFYRVTRDPVEGRVLYCGGSRRIKGHDVLAASWRQVLRRHPRAQLRFVGWPNGTPPPDLPSIRVTGAVSAEELAVELGRASVVVIPSRYEVSPILLGEAWASGTPVVATTAGGLASLAPGASRVVQSESSAALAGALIDALAPEAAEQTADLVAAGRRRADAYREQAVVSRHLSLYGELLDGR